jgi:hypothetical protein
MVDKLGPSQIVPIPRPRRVTVEDEARKQPRRREEPEKEESPPDDEEVLKGGFIDDHV